MSSRKRSRWGQPPSDKVDAVLADAGAIDDAKRRVRAAAVGDFSLFFLSHALHRPSRQLPVSVLRLGQKTYELQRLATAVWGWRTRTW